MSNTEVDDASNDVLFEQMGSLGLITLNRPRALNALTHNMCLKIEAQLNEWATNDSVVAVAVVGAGEKAFCAGGDIRDLYDKGRKDPDDALVFYRDEYRLNVRIKNYNKPYIGLIDGITMGGGVGVSVHGSHRVVTERTVFAMPETGIGLFPDVGGSYFLPRCPGRLGFLLGLTGERLNASDTMFCGLATAFVESAAIPSVLDALGGLGDRSDVDKAIAQFISPPDLPSLASRAAEVDRLFDFNTFDAFWSNLEQESGQSALAKKILDALRTKSPTSLKISYRQLIEGAGLDFEACMKMEFRMISRVMAGPDFYEGVRAVIIDKDNNPNWSPPSIAAVSGPQVDEYFAALGPKELAL